MPKNPEGKNKCAAVLTIRDAGKMTAKGRKDIAKWLMMHADQFVEMGHKYDERKFTGRYMVSG